MLESVYIHLEAAVPSQHLCEIVIDLAVILVQPNIDPWYEMSRQIGLINAGVTGLGLLTNEGPPHWHPASAELKDLCRNASLYCQEQGVELGKLAIHYALQQPGHCSHLVGMKTLAELQCNLEVATTGLTEAKSKVLDHVKEKYVLTFGRIKSGHSA
ncbi:hypothetical protein J6590_028435 [Homalodisca vitripennis]|nr:hypothetical protein J6590_028435 [Homalodisca vitripennis]